MPQTQRQDSLKHASKGSEDGSFIKELDMDDTLFDMARREEPKILDGKYLMGKLLGRGATAEVVEVLDLQTLQRKVVKVFKVARKHSLHPGGAEAKVRQISSEYLVLKRLQHRNVLRVYEMMRQETEWQLILAVVTEYCAGTLEELRLSLPDHRIPLNNCHFYFRQLVEGIEFLHSRGVSHGDLKPDNLLIRNDNSLRLADFGSYIDVGLFPDSEIRSGVSFASPYFQLPEALAADDEEPRDREARVRRYFAADVWSAGVVLFMMASGQHPFLPTDEASRHQLHQAIMRQAIVRSSVLDQNRALDLLIRKIFTVDIKRRATVTDIQRDVWFNMDYVPSHKAGMPVRKNADGKSGDKYRSMSMTAALNQLVRPVREVVKVLGKDLQDFEERKEIPYLRGNKCPEPVRPPPTSLFQRMRNHMTELSRRF